MSEKDKKSATQALEGLKSLSGDGDVDEVMR